MLQRLTHTGVQNIYERHRYGFNCVLSRLLFLYYNVTFLISTCKRFAFFRFCRPASGKVISWIGLMYTEIPIAGMRSVLYVEYGCTDCFRDILSTNMAITFCPRSKWLTPDGIRRETFGFTRLSPKLGTSARWDVCANARPSGKPRKPVCSRWFFLPS